MTLALPTLIAALLASGSPERITLDDALAEAARGNPELRIARAQLEAADADVVAAWSGFLPRLDVQLSFGHTWDGKTTYVDPRTGERVPGLTIPATDFEAYRAGLQLRLPMFDGFRTTREVQRSRATRRANALGVDEAALRTAFEVTRRFYGAVLAARTLDVLERAVARSEQLVARAAGLVTGGRGAKADVLQARVDLANDQLAVESQRLQLAQTRSALATTLGRAGDAKLDPIARPSSTRPRR